MPFGGYRSDAATPVREIYFAIVGATLAAADTVFSAGTYTMPFAGHLFIDLHAQVRWPGTNTLPNGAAVWLMVDASSTPAAGTAPQLGLACDAAGIYDAQQEIRTYGAFYNLTAGQVVTLKAKVTTNVLGNLVNVVYIGGNFRPTAT